VSLFLVATVVGWCLLVMVMVVCWWVDGHMHWRWDFLVDWEFHFLVGDIRLVDGHLDVIRDWLLDDVWNLLDDFVRLVDWVWNLHFNLSGR
jgi:hypothetical protein